MPMHLLTMQVKFWSVELSMQTLVIIRLSVLCHLPVTVVTTGMMILKTLECNNNHNLHSQLQSQRFVED